VLFALVLESNVNATGMGFVALVHNHEISAGTLETRFPARVLMLLRTMARRLAARARVDFQVVESALPTLMLNSAPSVFDTSCRSFHLVANLN